MVERYQTDWLDGGASSCGRSTQLVWQSCPNDCQRPDRLPAEHYRQAQPLTLRRLRRADVACMTAISQRALAIIDQPADAAREQVLLGTATSVVGLVANAPASGTRTQPETPLSEVMQAIRSRPDGPWTRDEVTNRPGSQPCSSEVRQMVGMDLRQFVRRSRIEMAQQLLLEEPQRSIGAIGTQCGFTSLAAFSATFRSLAGQSRARGVRLAWPV